MDEIIEPKYAGCTIFRTNKHSVDRNILLVVYVTHTHTHTPHTHHIHTHTHTTYTHTHTHTHKTGCPLQKLHLNYFYTAASMVTNCMGNTHERM